MTMSEDDILRDYAGKVILNELREAAGQHRPETSLSVTHMAERLNKRQFKDEGACYQLPAERTLRGKRLKGWFADGWKDPKTGIGFVLDKEFSLEASEVDYDL